MRMAASKHHSRIERRRGQWVYTHRQVRFFGMDVSKILAELSAEREQIEEAIGSLERLARGRGRGAGRPPNWMAKITPKGGGETPPSASSPPVPKGGDGFPGDSPSPRPPRAAGAALPLPRGDIQITPAVAGPDKSRRRA